MDKQKLIGVVLVAIAAAVVAMLAAMNMDWLRYLGKQTVFRKAGAQVKFSTAVETTDTTTAWQPGQYISFDTGQVAPMDVDTVTMQKLETLDLSTLNPPQNVGLEFAYAQMSFNKIRSTIRDFKFGVVYRVAVPTTIVGAADSVSAATNVAEALRIIDHGAAGSNLAKKCFILS